MSPSEIEPHLLHYYLRQNWNQLMELPDELVNELMNFDILKIMSFIDNVPILEGSSKTTPMFSSIDDAIFYSVDLLRENDYTFDELGKELPGCHTDSSKAFKKYGECHSKILASVGIVSLTRQHCTQVKLTPLGQSFACMSYPQRRICFSKMIISIPIVQNILKKAVNYLGLTLMPDN